MVAEQARLRTAAWLLERRFRARWARKVELPAEGSVEGRTFHQNVHVEVVDSPSGPLLAAMDQPRKPVDPELGDTIIWRCDGMRIRNDKEGMILISPGTRGKVITRSENLLAHAARKAGMPITAGPWSGGVADCTAISYYYPDEHSPSPRRKLDHSTGCLCPRIHQRGKLNLFALATASSTS